MAIEKRFSSLQFFPNTDKSLSIRLHPMNDSFPIENGYFSVVYFIFQNKSKQNKTKQFNFHPFHLHFLLHLFHPVQNFPKYIDCIDIKTNNSP